MTTPAATPGILPAPGDVVEIQTPEPTYGYLLGTHMGPPAALAPGAGPRPYATVATAAGVRIVPLPAGGITAGADPDRLPTARAVLAMLADQAQRLRRRQELAEADRRADQEWRDSLVEDAHAWATANGLCDAFDDFMETHGLPGRERDFQFNVEVSAPVTISATTPEDAERQIAGADIAALLGDCAAEDINISWSTF